MQRRDFTINAIFLDPDGTIHDPVGGLPDLRAAVRSLSPRPTPRMC
jgi:tRNA nucleotidyltransferase/poly(A) polymerase